MLPVRQHRIWKLVPKLCGVSPSYFSPQPLTGLLALLGTLTEAALPVRQDRTLKLVPHFCEVSPSCSSPQPLTGLLAHLGTLARAVVPVCQHRLFGTQHPETHPPSLRGRTEFSSMELLTGLLAPSGNSHRSSVTGTSTPDLEARPSGVSLSYFSSQPLTGLLALLGTLTRAVLPVRQDRTLKLVLHFCEVSPSCSSPQPLTGLLALPGTLGRAVVPVRQHLFFGTQHPETHPSSL